MKKILICIILLSPILIFFSSCSRKEINISVEKENVIIYADDSDLPDIYLNGIKESWSSFTFYNADNFIYVYDNKICTTNISPEEFSTELIIYYKGNKSVTKCLTIVKNFIPIDYIEIISDTTVYPGQSVKYSVMTFPENSFLKNYTIDFDKPQYIESIDKDSFKLNNDVPHNTEIILTVTDETGVSAFKTFNLSYNIYDIYNANQFSKVSNDLYGYYYIKNDIDFTNYKFKPINIFYGVIEGNSCSLKNLKIELQNKNETMNESFGLIRELRGSLKNLIFSNYNLTFVQKHNNITNFYVGGICGILNGGVLNNIQINSQSKIWAYHDLDDPELSSFAYVGGFVGKMINGNIEKCTLHESEVFGKARVNTNNGTTADCQAYVGGIVGYQESGSVNLCVRDESGKVTAYTLSGSKKSAYHCHSGGVVGYKIDGSIFGSYSSPYEVFIFTETINDLFASSSTKGWGQVCGGGPDLKGY